jgi:ATP-dependent DNA helicase Rep
LFAAAFEPAFQHDIPERQLMPLVAFCDFINRMEYRAAREPAGEVLADLVRAIDYEAWLYESQDARTAENRWHNVEDFTGWFARKGEEEGKTLVEMAQAIALASMFEADDGNDDAVRLSTLHAAKGLEFEHVFLVGVEEGLLPHRESVDAGTVEEERRLFYVGITRACRILTISHCARRKRAGELAMVEPSRFLRELAGDGVRMPGRDDADPSAAKARGAAHLADLRAILGTREKGANAP